MNIKKLFTQYRWLILACRDLLSFLFGIVISGFCVSLVINPNNNLDLLISIVCGLVFGICCAILLKIIRNYEKLLNKVESNADNKTKSEIKQKTWELINSTNSPTKRILFLKPCVWIYLAPLMAITSISFGVYEFDVGNTVKQLSEGKKIEDERNIFNRKIDSLCQNMHQKQTYEVTITKLEQQIVNNKYVIDSLKQAIKKRGPHLQTKSM